MRAHRLLPFVDAHAAGEPSRVLIGSHLLVAGPTMRERLRNAEENLDWLRRLVLREPRGYPASCAVLVTAPCDSRADAGIIVLEHGGFRPMSGSNTICAVTALLETGALPTTGASTTVTIDTAVGLVEATATVADGKVREVAIRNVPSFVEVLDHPLHVPHVGDVEVDVVFGGQYYVQARAADIGIELRTSAARKIVEAGVLIRQAAREQISVKHPDNPEINDIHLTMLHGDSDTPGVSARNAVVMPNAEVDFENPGTWTGTLDRSPCGTGTCARMAAKHARGELAFGQRFIHESMLGTTFTGYLDGAVPGHPRGAVLPVIAGQAWITAIGNVVLDDTDPFPTGYTLPDLWAQ
jgi:proline racemase